MLSILPAITPSCELKTIKLGRNILTIVTRLRLSMRSLGHQPDIIRWRGNNFIVRALQDYSQYRRGFVQAEASSIDSQNLPPDSPQIG